MTSAFPDPGMAAGTDTAVLQPPALEATGLAVRYRTV
jgi:hypothetical protein